MAIAFANLLLSGVTLGLVFVMLMRQARGSFAAGFADEIACLLANEPKAPAKAPAKRPKAKPRARKSRAVTRS